MGIISLSQFEKIVKETGMPLTVNEEYELMGCNLRLKYMKEDRSVKVTGVIPEDLLRVYSDELVRRYGEPFNFTAHKLEESAVLDFANCEEYLAPNSFCAMFKEEEPTEADRVEPLLLDEAEDANKERYTNCLGFNSYNQLKIFILMSVIFYQKKQRAKDHI